MIIVISKCVSSDRSLPLLGRSHRVKMWLSVSSHHALVHGKWVEHEDPICPRERTSCHRIQSLGETHQVRRNRSWLVRCGDLQGQMQSRLWMCSKLSLFHHPLQQQSVYHCYYSRNWISGCTCLWISPRFSQRFCSIRWSSCHYHTMQDGCCLERRRPEILHCCDLPRTFSSPFEKRK